MTAAPNDTSLREILGTIPNPSREIDCLVLLDGTMRPRGAAAPLGLTLRYIPDRLIIEPDKWQGYLAALSTQNMPALEALAVRVLSDANNEIVPRWLSVVVSDSSSSHKVIVEDRQPKWDNPDLLRRVPGI